MTTEYRDFHRYAVEAIKNEGCEFSLRNSMSRGYYAVYHIALTYADSISLPPVSDYAGPTHRKLSKFYEDSLNADLAERRNLRRLGYCLKQLHKGRCDADYELQETTHLLSAQAHLRSCGARLNEFEALINKKAA